MLQCCLSQTVVFVCHPHHFKNGALIKQTSMLSALLNQRVVTHTGKTGKDLNLYTREKKSRYLVILDFPVIRVATLLNVYRVFFFSCPLSPVVSKASSGAMEWSPVYSTPSMKNFLKVRILFYCSNYFARIIFSCLINLWAGITLPSITKLLSYWDDSL